jgi:deoxyribodipyrimidine photo-lyase
MPSPVVHWFRRDLRLEDNTALRAAMSSGAPVLAVFMLDDRILLQSTMGTHRLRFLRSALRALDTSLRQRGSRLFVLRTDDVPRELNRLVQETQAWCVYFNRDYTPYARARDTRVTRGMQLTGILTQSFADQLLVEPYATMDSDGEPALEHPEFKQRWLAGLDLAAAQPEPEEGVFAPDAEMPPGLRGWDGPWAEEIAEESPWPGATPASARARLDEFTQTGLRAYARGDGSRLSAALKFGTISVREVARAVLGAATSDPGLRQSAESFLEALSWRDFATHLLFARAEPPRDGGGGHPDAVALWADSQTGVRSTDDGMRRLTDEGWIPERTRIELAAHLAGLGEAASRAGERIFMRRLVDADLACNHLGWQRAAAGADRLT